MRVLVVGANGLVGSNVVAACRERDWPVSGTYHSTAPEFDVPTTQFDLKDATGFDALIDRRDPDVVVNCAAMTDVDACERDPECAQRINGRAPGTLAARCAERRCRFLQVSTDYVFDGREHEQYDEDAAPNPIQAYGRSKLHGERAVQDTLPEALIVRLSFVYGHHRGSDELVGFPAWVRDRTRAGEAVSLFVDQWVTPTRAGQASETMIDLIEVGATGRYHVAAQSCVTPFEFADVLVSEMGLDEPPFRESSLDDIDRAAPRPAHSCLATDRVATTLGRPQPTLTADVTTLLEGL